MQPERERNDNSTKFGRGEQPKRLLWRASGEEGIEKKGQFYLESLTSSLLPRMPKRKKLERMAGSRVS